MTHGLAPSTNWYRLISIFFLFLITVSVSAQNPTPTPDSQGKRGLGIKAGEATSAAGADQGQREAKPELVMQTGYNNFFGATRLVFSPDGRLLATTAFRSSTVKLWDTSTGRELRNLSSGGQSSLIQSPVVTFSRDSRLIAASTGDNTVRVWDVVTGRELQTLSGAQGSILSAIGVYFVGFSGDGRRLVSGSDAIRIWDLTSGNMIREIAADVLNEANLTADGGLALSPDGSQLARIDDRTETEIRIWDLNSGRELPALKVSSEQVDSAVLSFTADRRLLAAGIVEKRLKVWELTGKTSEHQLGTTTGDFSLLTFSHDGRLLALCEGYTVKIFDVRSGRELRTLNVPNSGVMSGQLRAVFAGLSDDGSKIATGGFGTQTILWESETGKQLLQMKGSSNMAYEVAFTADGSQLLSGGRTRWDLRTGRGLRVTAGQSGQEDKSFAVPSTDGRLLAEFNPGNGVVSLLDTTTGQQLQTFNPAASNAGVQRVVFSPDGRLLVSSYYNLPKPEASSSIDNQATRRAAKAPRDPAAAMKIYQQTVSQPQGANIENQVKIWDTASGRELHTLATGLNAGVARFTADGRVLATLGSTGAITLWDTESGSRLRDLSAATQSNPASMLGNLPSFGNPGSMKKKGQPVMPNMADINAMMTNILGTMSAGTMGHSVTSIAFSGDGRMIAAGGVESKSNLDMATLMTRTKGQKNSRNQKAQDPGDFLTDMKVEATGQIVLWDALNGREIATLKSHGKGVSQVALSRDGRLLASASTDNTIKIWDVSAQRELRLLNGHRSNINSLAFSPDGRLLASASDDGGTFLWDTATGEHLLTLVSLNDGGEWLVVTPEGLFDGTPASWNQILWRYNQDTFNVAPIEWFFNEFFYPGLLADVFAGKRPHIAQDVGKKDRRQPIVKLTIPGGGPVPPTAISSRTVKVRIEVSEEGADKEHAHGCGARDVRLFRNGSLVKVWHGDVLKGQATSTLEQEISLVAGDNRLAAYGFNNDNVKSKDARLTLSGAPSLQRAGTAYLIAVGVNQYANPQYNLKYAVADANSFSEELGRRQTQLRRFEHVEVVTLTNQEATKANILSALRRLSGAELPVAPTLKAGTSQALNVLKRAQPEDAVIIYFAGHGTAQGQRFYLIPHDLGYEGQRTKLNEEGLKTILAHSISDVELEQAVEDLDTGNLLLVIDACNSGQALEAEEKRRGPMNSKGLAQLAYEKGMFILTAAQSFQAALEASQLGHGLLTYVLVEEGLKTAIADNDPKDGLVSAREWLDFATERVPLMQAEKMQQSRGIGLDFGFTEDEQRNSDPEKRSVQRPRVFYRRELEINPLVIAKP